MTECPLSFPHRDLRVRAVLLASLISPGGGGGEWAGGHGLCTCAWPWASPVARPYSYGFSWITAIMVSLEPQGCPSYLKSSCPGLLPGVPDHCLWPGHYWLQCAFIPLLHSVFHSEAREGSRQTRPQHPKQPITNQAACPALGPCYVTLRGL